MKTISQTTSLFRAPHSFNILLHNTILYNILLYIYIMILYLSKHFIYIISIYLRYLRSRPKPYVGHKFYASRSQLWIISYSSLALFVALLLPNTFTNVQMYNCQICMSHSQMLGKFEYTLPAKF